MKNTALDEGGVGALSHKMDELILSDSEETSSAWNPEFNLYLHTCIYFAILSSE